MPSNQNTVLFWFVIELLLLLIACPLFPYILEKLLAIPTSLFFHLLVNGFCVTCFSTFFKLTVLSYSLVLYYKILIYLSFLMYTGNNLDKGNLILMLQVRQLSLVTSHPYLPFCKHIIPTLHFILLKKCWALFLSFFC